MANVIRSNRLIKRTIMKSYLPCFLVALVFNLNLVVDIFLASIYVARDVNFFTNSMSGVNPYSVVAAIGIAYPITSLLAALLLAYVQGTSIKYNDALARGYKDQCTKIFSQAIWSILLAGLAVSLINFFVADFVVQLFGANENDLLYFASLYLKLSGFGITFAALNRLYSNTLVVYGRDKAIFFGNIINIVTNIVLSIVLYETLGKVEMPFLFIYGAPAGYKLCLGVGAFALGSFLSEAITFLFYVVIKNSKHNEARWTFVPLSFSSFIDSFVKGFPIVAYIVIEALVGGIINLIIMYASCWNTSTISGVQALTVYSTVRIFAQLSQVASQAMSLSTIPIIGLFYGAKDKDAVKSVWKNGVGIGFLFTLGWAATLLLIALIVVNAYAKGTEGLASYITYGVLCVIPCSVFFTFLFMLQTFYGVINRPGSSMLVSLIPQAVIYPLALVILINACRCGSNNLIFVWLTMGLNGVLFFLIAYIGNVIKNKKAKVDLDKLLQLNEGECRKLPLFDVSINTLEEVSQLAETIQVFFKENEVSDRTSMFAALAVDEIANDIMKRGDIKITKLPENISYLDIKILTDNNFVKVIIRDAGNFYNPLAFSQLIDNAAKFGVKAVQKMARYINYQRLYKMNIITIEIDK